VRSGEQLSTSGGIVFPGEQLVVEAVGLGRHAEDLRPFRRDAGELPDQAVGGIGLVGGDVLPRKALGHELVCGDLARWVECGARAEYASRPFRIPGRSVGAHALHAHRLPRGAREERRIEGSVARVVATVGAGPRNPDRAYLLLRQAEQLGHAIAHEVRLLRAGPHRAAVDLHLGDGAGGPHARMRLERPFVLRLDDFCTFGKGRSDIAAPYRLLALDHLRRADVVVQPLHLGKGAIERMPVDLQPLRRPYRVPFARRHHGDEILLADHARAGNAFDRALINAAHLASRARRPDDARM
jgi:hypothetical protein